jgi:hypothetical protein
MYQTWATSIAWVTLHQRELAIGFTFAIICYVLAELVKTGSSAAVRKLRNKLSEYSVARLQNRISQLEMSRDRVNFVHIVRQGALSRHLAAAIWNTRGHVSWSGDLGPRLSPRRTAIRIRALGDIGLFARDRPGRGGNANRRIGHSVKDVCKGFKT